MLAGIQLSDGLKLEAIADGGFSYAEIPYEIIEKNELPTYKKKDGDSRVRTCAFCYSPSNTFIEILYTYSDIVLLKLRYKR